MNHPYCRGWLSKQGASCPDVRRVVTGRHHSKDCMERGRRKNSFRLERSVWRAGAGETSLHRSREQNESKIDSWYVARNAQQQCRMNASLGLQMVYSELAKSDGWNLRADGTKKP